MESFFHTLKVELTHGERWATRGRSRHASDRRELFAYIEGYSNRGPMHSALGYLTLEQAETRMAS
jgi:transposase InsO family protein